MVVAVMLMGTYFDNKAKRERETVRAAKEAQANTIPEGAAVRSTAAQDHSYETIHSDWFSGLGGKRGGTMRERSASQIIKRGDASGDLLPMGTQVRVRLAGQVESMDASSPVTATLLEDALSPSQTVVIPKGTKVIGTGQLDANRERLQVHFHTLVFPDGEQFGLAAIAAMPDGSSGLGGDFSSGLFRRHASQFIGSFVGGLAEGMKDRTSVGAMGIPLEPGSLKNGALNGIAQSSLDYAKSSSDQMGQSSASIKVPSGKEFIMYFEREFHQ
jgi:type IV secretory pathway VirB10-like protein